MKQKKILLALASGFALSGFIAVATIVAVSPRKMYTANGDNSPYQLLLNNNNRIYSSSSFTGSSPVSGTVYTSLNNPVSISGYKIKTYSSGWQTIMPDGYVYNQLNNSATHNKISGIHSIKYNGNGSLALHYGYTANDTQLFYSTSKTLTSGTEYVFDDADTPSFFYLQNESSSNVNITNLSIKYSCNEQACPKNNLNVLMIGNSFSDDTIYYAKEIAGSYGITLNLYDAYIASCTLDTHYNNLVNSTADYSLRTMNGLSWIYADGKTIDQVLDFKEWDYITFQQASSAVGRSSSYSNLSNYVSQVRSKVGAGPVFDWYQTWAYDSDYMEFYDYFSYFNNNRTTMYNAINSCYQSEVASLNVFDKIIPAGTAVENLRTSYMGDTFSKDGKHMSNAHGRYLLGLNFVSSLLDIDLDLSPCSYLPEGINSSFKTVANEAIRNARKTPLAITNSAYTNSEMANYDLTNYKEIDVGFVGNSYYLCTDASNPLNRFGNVSGTSSQYVSTKLFNSDTLPVGSLVFCPEGFGYRPEAWVNESTQSSRVNEMYDNVYQIPSSFWSGYTLRAFNIFKAGKSSLTGQFRQVFESFRIFVPASQAGNEDIVLKGFNAFAAEDRALFTEKYVNFDAFERVQLDPIIGFYNCSSYYNLTNTYSDDTGKKFVCSRPFFTQQGELPLNSVIVCDSGYQWRSDCWSAYGKNSNRPGNVSTAFTLLDDSSFMDNWRVRTLNVSMTNSGYINQNAIGVMSHVRVYVPVDDDMFLERPDKSKYLTFTALGTVNLKGTAASMIGSSTSVLITLTGESNTSVRVEVAGTDISADSYNYNKSTKLLTISTSGSTYGYDYGTISGTFNPDAGTYSGISISGSMKSFVSNNGSITAREMWHDRCSYASEAEANVVWQRWYGSTWTKNSGNGGWTSPTQNYTLENDYSLGLRIASSSYSRTRFTLKSDLNNGAGMSVHGFSIWFYNPNGAIYSNFRIFAYKTASTVSGGVATPSSSYETAISKDSSFFANAAWVNVKVGWTGTLYNLSLFFQSTSSSNTYIYMGHISIY